jgi:hypothetical protein
MKFYAVVKIVNKYLSDKKVPLKKKEIVHFKLLKKFIINQLIVWWGNIQEVLQFHSTTRSHWSNGQSFASLLGGQRFASRGCTNSLWNRVSPVSDVSLHW